MLIVADDGVEFATLFIDDDLYALPAVQVTEAFPAAQIALMSMNERPECIGMLALPEQVVRVFDLGHRILVAHPGIESSSQVLADGASD